MKKKTINKRKIRQDAIGLDYAMAKFMLPRLQWLEKNTMSHPAYLTMDEWRQILRDMQLAFQTFLDYDKDPNAFKPTEEMYKNIEKSFELFGKYYTELWS